MGSRHKTKRVKRRRRRDCHSQKPSGFESSSAVSSEGWPVALRERPDLSLTSDNTSFLQTRARLGEEDKNDIYEIFMRGPADPVGRIPRAVKLESFASGMSLDVLRIAQENGDLRPAVWRDDRNYRNKSAVPGAACKALTAYGLCLDFSKPRFPSSLNTSALSYAPIDDQTQDQKSSSVAPISSMTNGTTSLELDADRRLVYINDLDRYTIFAVVWTASPHQVPALRNALYHHLDFNALLEMSVNIGTFPAFELAFHLPFFVLKINSPRRGDHRVDNKKKTLRRSYNLPSLDGPKGTSSDWLHEAHISCTVTGSDEVRWMAYAFIDTYYFDANDEDREDATENEADALEDDRADLSVDEEGDLEDHTMCPDALTYGVEDAGKPIWNPRIYFLAVFARRLQQARREWENVVMNFTERIRAFEEVHENAMSDSTRFQSSDEQRNTLDIHESLAWVLKTKHLTDRMCKVLGGTIRAYEPFCSRHEACGDGSLRFPQGHRLLAEVYKTFEILCQLEFKLSNLVHSCGQYESELHARLNAIQSQITAKAMAVSNEQLELSTTALELGKKQSQFAQESKRFSWIMMLYVSPIALTASVFSMEESVLPKVLPFVKPNVGWFIGLICIFELVGIIVHAAWSQWGKLGKLAGEAQRYRDFWSPSRWFTRSRKSSVDEESRPVTPVTNAPPSPPAVPAYARSES
ncbi:hypothetical protein LTR84_010546 [Exophiala bonariae]|uniref:Uncharacterized protein n=1 Tax=Exophiala bonariae TaxID=1690606 RepID=A0AAV9MTC5_9EURO|nr:hypothetical protein LTR84_010546 [Exophiala bonariae]